MGKNDQTRSMWAIDNGSRPMVFHFAMDCPDFPRLEKAVEFVVRRNIVLPGGRDDEAIFCPECMRLRDIAKTGKPAGSIKDVIRNQHGVIPSEDESAPPSPEGPR